MDKMITPSILNVQEKDRTKVIQDLLNLGIKWFHFDVMDQKFVPYKAISIEEIINFKNNIGNFLCDVHLMVNDPFYYARKLSNYVTCLTIHFESFENKKQIIDFINEFSHNNWIGLAINPATNFEDIKHLIFMFDLILIMSVEPGQGGQKFLEQTFDKIKQIKSFIDDEKLSTIIQVDGGIKDTNSKKIFNIGSTFNVVGSYLIKNINKITLKKLK